MHNGLRYLHWGRDGEAVQLEKGLGVGNCLKMAQNPQRQVHALLAVLLITNFLNSNYKSATLKSQLHGPFTFAGEQP